MQVAGKDEGEGSRDAGAGKDEEEDEQVWCERRKGSAQAGRIGKWVIRCT